MLKLSKFVSGLFPKIKLIAVSVASENRIFVNKLVTSHEIRNSSVTLTDLISSINVKLSFV